MSLSPTVILLSDEDCYAARVCGAVRHAESMAEGRRDRHGASETEGLRLHIFGAEGEIAAARALGFAWTASVGTFKGPDLGGDIQVRARRRHSYDLIVRDDDAPTHRYIHATSEAAACWYLWGWCIGSEARLPEWRKTHGGREAAWFVPASALHTMRELSACTVA